MQPIKNRILLTISSFIVAFNIGCGPDAGALSSSSSKEPIVDFRAIASLSDDVSEFSSVLIKIRLLNSNTDILKFGISTPEEHQSRLNYYRVDFKYDVKLISQGDTIPCYDLHAERLYMDLPYMNFIATFHHPVSAEDEIMIHDVVYTSKDVFVAIEQNEQSQ